MQLINIALLVSILFHFTIIIILEFLSAITVPGDSFRSKNYYFEIISIIITNAIFIIFRMLLVFRRVNIIHYVRRFLLPCFRGKFTSLTVFREMHFSTKFAFI